MEPDEMTDADCDEIILKQEEERLVDCYSDDAEHEEGGEAKAAHELAGGEVEASEEQVAGQSSSPGSSAAEVHDFLHHLNELQLFYKARLQLYTCHFVEAQKLVEERNRHAAELASLDQVRKAIQEVTRVQVNVDYHGACTQKQLQDVQSKNEILELDIRGLLGCTRTLSRALEAQRNKLRDETALHIREEERMRQLNRETRLYFDDKPQRKDLRNQEAELVQLRLVLQGLEEAELASKQQRGLTEAALDTLQTQINNQTRANEEQARKIGETKHVASVTQSLYNDARVRHTSTKKMLKEDLLAMLRELSDTSAECHTAECMVTELNKTVLALGNRLDGLSKEAELKKKTRTGGPQPTQKTRFVTAGHRQHNE